MIELSRNHKKMLAKHRADFRLKQRWQAIDWEFDYLKPKIAEFLARARLPELPSSEIVELETLDDVPVPADTNPLKNPSPLTPPDIDAPKAS